MSVYYVNSTVSAPFCNPAHVHKHKSENLSLRTAKISPNNQFFETQHKNKLDESVYSSRRSKQGGKAEKRSQVEEGIFLHAREQERKKINLKIINSEARGRERWR